MKKLKKFLFSTAVLLASAVALFSQETLMKVYQNGNVVHSELTWAIDSIKFYDLVSDGVLINGIVWAKYNVDAPGAFAANPESFGMYYQWNRKVGWSSTDPLVDSNGGTTWDTSRPTGDIWEAANDPSPAGWRVPTENEFYSLLDGDKVSSEWTTLNGVAGRKFTDKATGASIFLPAAGLRGVSDGTFAYRGSVCQYWTSSKYNTDYEAYTLWSGSSSATEDYYYTKSGMSVRCVLNSPNDKLMKIYQNGNVVYSEFTSAIDSIKYDSSVELINGVSWATCNVDAPGAFAANAEDAGMFYQWNRKLGWSSTDPLVNSSGGTAWNSSTPTGDAWEAANDPSPAGFRVPTYDEIQSLLNTTYVSSEGTTLNGVKGRRFTDKATGASIFLPAAGNRSQLSGRLSNAGAYGYYWSSTQGSSSNAYLLYVSSNDVNTFNFNRGYGYSLRCVKAYVPVTGITLNKTALTLTVGGTEKLTAKVSPGNATDRSVTWTTDNASVATVSSDGAVTAVAPGRTVITAKAEDKTATCIVTVMEAGASTTDPGVVINGVTWATRNVDAPGAFAAYSEDAGMFYQWNRKLGWSSTDPLVNSNGGTAWDTSTPTGDTWEAANDPSPAGWRVPTYDEIQSLVNTTYVSSEWTTLNGVAGRKFTDKATGASIFLPAAGNRSNSNGTLDEAGTVGYYWNSTAGFGDYVDPLHFHSGGADAGIIALYRSYGVSVRCVLKAVTSITLNKTTLFLTVDGTVKGTEKLTATVNPGDATDRSVTWTTDNASVATVSSDGTVTAVAQGTAVITAKAGDKTATCIVTVAEPDPNGGWG
jgi:uncharacterized protein (TIGR02145 family)